MLLPIKKGYEREWEGRVVLRKLGCVVMRGVYCEEDKVASRVVGACKGNVDMLLGSICRATRGGVNHISPVSSRTRARSGG